MKTSSSRLIAMTTKPILYAFVGISIVAASSVDAEAGFFRKRLRERAEAASYSQTNGDLSSIEVQAGGRTRNYLMYVPSSYKRGVPVPLVLSFHGGGDNAHKMAEYTRFPELAEREGFIVVFPNGTKGRSSNGGTWNTGSGEGMGVAEKRNVDDLGFVAAALARIKRDYSIDPHRIYATGMSKGGMFAYEVACSMSSQFAAIAPVSSTMVSRRCDPSVPVAVFHIHGAADQNVPLNGGRGKLTGAGFDYPPVAKGIDFWRKQDKCSAEKTQWSLAPDTRCETYASCAQDVSLCIVEGGGHAWPGQTPMRWQNMTKTYVTQSFDATREVWQFFEKHPKR